MKETEAIIERVRRINDAYQHLEISVDSTLTRIKPGQSLMARLHQTWDPYLYAHWWPVGVSENRIIVERPAGERFDPGQIVTLIGLVGQPLLFRRTLRNVMLLAYDTAPTPLLMTVPWLLGNNISVTLVLLGTAVQYATGHLPPQVEIVHGEGEMDWPNQVMTVGWADQVFAVVGRDDESGRFSRLMERFRELRNDVPSNYLFGVFQPVLPCAAGACHACVLPLRTGSALVCTEGPAYDLTQVMLR
ncbi:MAG: hypothetical protein SF029_01845 [bacterium]|nr:hypothetical protein [bacterium]